MSFKVKFDYYDVHDFHKRQQTPDNQKLPFSVYHTNIRSPMGNFDKLQDHLIKLQHKFDIVGLSETWNSSSNRGKFKPGTLAGYHAYLGTTGSSLKSGCGLYINNNLKFKERNDLKFSFFDDENEFQSKWVETSNGKTTNIVVGIFYRHPKKGKQQKFTEFTKSSLLKIRKEKKIIYLMGDFNFNLLKSSQ